MFEITNSHVREKLIDKSNELILTSAIEIAQTNEMSRQQLKKWMAVEKMYTM